MALLFMDGFDCYGTGDVTSIISCKWGSTPTTNLSAVAGKGQGNALSINDTVTLVSPRFDNLTALIVGFWFKKSALGAYTESLLGFRSIATDYVDVRVNASNFLIVTRNGTTLGTGTTTISADTWYFLEFKAFIDNTSGSVHVQLNGSLDINVFGVDTQNGTDAFVNEFVLEGLSGFTITYDHLYCCDTSGSRLNDFLNLIEIESMKPNAEGTNTAWTPSAGDNWENVDDNPPDDDTTYNEAASTTLKDTHNFTNPVHNGDKLAVVNNVVAKKTDAGSVSVRGAIRTGGQEFDGTTHLAHPDYQHGESISETNPDTTEVWSHSELEGAEFGYQRVT
jgi:hypothetical protein